MQLDIIRAIQSLSNPVLDVLVQLLTIFGESVPLTVVLCGIYWSLDKELGRSLAFALCTSLGANGVIKDLVKAPRPIGQPGVFSLRVETATGYSFPSGHSQSSAVFWSTLAMHSKKRKYHIAAALLIVGVGLSRLYLGVHYPIDALVGILLGCGIAFGVNALLKRRHGKTILFAIWVVLAVLSLMVGESGDTFSGVGIILGMLAGLWTEQRYVAFSTRRIPTKTRLLRFFVGIVLLGVIYLLFSLVLPPIQPVRVFKYAFIAFFGIGLYPLLFTRFEKRGQRAN